MSLPLQWTELRARTHARHSCSAGSGPARDAIRAVLDERLADADVVETLVSGGRLRAGVALCPEERSWFGVPLVHWLVDCDPDDAEAVRWTIARLGELSGRAGPDLYMQLDAANHALLPAARALQAHVSSLILLGRPAPCLERLLDGRPARLPPGVRFAPMAGVAHVEEVLDLKRRYFSVHPEHGWFIAGEPNLARERRDLIESFAAAEATRWIVARGDEVLGVVGFRLDRASPFWGCVAGMDLTLDPSLHGRGVGRAAYALMLRRMVDLGVDVFKGGTSNPAVLHLARRMRRPLLAWEIRHGAPALPASHFEYPLPATAATEVARAGG